MSKGTTMVFIFLWWLAHYYIPAQFRLSVLTMTSESVRMFDVVHMAFYFTCCLSHLEMPSEVFFVVDHVHPAAFEEQPQLPPPIVFQMLQLNQFLIEVEHARRKILLPKPFDVLQTESVGLVQGFFIYIHAIQSLQCHPEERVQLVIHITVKHFVNRNDHIGQLCPQEFAV